MFPSPHDLTTVERDEEIRIIPPVKVRLRSASLLFFLICVLLELPIHRRSDDRSIEPPRHTNPRAVRVSAVRFTSFRLPALVTIFLVLLYALALPGR